VRPSVKIAAAWVAYLAGVAAVVVAVVAGIVCLLTGHTTLGLSLWLVVAFAVALAFGLAARGRE
jgi:hypothetical protein